ncbi:ABC transporter permease [Conexibacter sp. DBS9H8]|uniref:ABC transporter permease n=1 Tax=Conexibacter sp. DBS9H8 TaxID=2937801 RepID=UPI00200CD092|nr:ABC transporter permease [Conexibacter sp. DBS9H8]
MKLPNQLKSKLSVRVIGAIYVWIALIVLFAILQPATFFNYGTVKQVLNEYAVTGLVALGLILPLAAGLYDLSVGAIAGLSGIGSAWFLAHVSANPFLALLAGLVAALLAGGVNIIVVIGMKVDSFIGTLATGSIITAVVTAIAGDNVITQNVNGSFQVDFGIKSVLGMTLPVGLMLVGMLLLAYLMEKTAVGRRLYATGYETEVARLGGVNVDRLRMATLLGSSLFAGLAGVCEAASLGAGDPTVGPAYLLPAFAAAFLGATQFRGGRFNPWGTVVAVLLLGTGDVGLLIVGAPAWTPSIFEGLLLITAVSLTHAHGLNPLRSLRNRFGNRQASADVTPSAGGAQMVDEVPQAATPTLMVNEPTAKPSGGQA